MEGLSRRRRRVTDHHHQHVLEVDRRKFQAEHNQSRRNKTVLSESLTPKVREDDAIRRIVLHAARRRRLLTKWDDLPPSDLKSSKDMLRDAPQAFIEEDLFETDEEVETPLLAALEFARAATMAERRGTHSSLLSTPFIQALSHLVPEDVSSNMEKRAKKAHEALAARASDDAANKPQNKRPWIIDLEETANENKQEFDAKARLPTVSRGFDQHSSRRVALTLAALLARGPAAVAAEKTKSEKGPRLIGINFE